MNMQEKKFYEYNINLKNAVSERVKATRRLIKFENQPKIVGRFAVSGEKESKGVIGDSFHFHEKADKMGLKTFELAEIRMFEAAIRGAINDADLTVQDIKLMVSGDLLNQITTSSYSLRDLKIPHLGVYGACSTMTEALLIGAAFVDSGYYDCVACATASHFATAERQFRYPLEYGCQRPPYAQWTVTGAACSVLSRTGNAPYVSYGLPGRIVDFGTDDLNNMGAAMAPAALDTLVSLIEESEFDLKDFDLIITGDLGKLGSDILRDLMGAKGYRLGNNYIDCGNIIYNVDQKCYQGGSGCACSATVFNSFILDKLERKEYKRVAYLATGALMSTQSCYQGETIPCTSHAVIVEA